MSSSCFLFSCIIIATQLHELHMYIILDMVNCAISTFATHLLALKLQKYVKLELKIISKTQLQAQLQNTYFFIMCILFVFDSFFYIITYLLQLATSYCCTFHVVNVDIPLMIQVCICFGALVGVNVLQLGIFFMILLQLLL